MAHKLGVKPTDGAKGHVRGLAAYASKPDESAAYDRMQFLQAIERHVPEVLEGLESIPSDANEETLGEWAERFRLVHEGKPAKWIIDVAKRTLATWKVISRESLLATWKKTGRHFDLNPVLPGPQFLPLTDDECSISVHEVFNWDPFLSSDTRTQKRDAILGVLTERLDKELDRIETLARGRGGEAPRSRKRAHNPRLPYEWLALSLCMGLTDGQIAMRYTERSEKPISRKAVNTIKMARWKLARQLRLGQVT